ncbi:hypothetical protein SAMN06265219_10256 [Gracilimonas mengyeensis]|uniref:Spermine/spermidine synthase n=2 Tax=Gracilimonas mengyeensis TaxID=1302730 RepID=A0A521B660_9BACT|nr:hypothetical protein SAMN06265219_10256 [Gracilimonas mengyeensis]
MILSLAILGLSCGSIFAYYRLNTSDKDKLIPVLRNIQLGLAGSLGVFIVAVTSFSFITNHLVYFFLLVIPFFLAGLFYAKVFETYAAESFTVYAADLAGAAIGSVAAILAISALGPVNGVLLLAALIICSALSLVGSKWPKAAVTGLFVLAIAGGGWIIFSGHNTFMDRIPIGDFPEKDFHHTYPDQFTQSIITDSRWSVYGRADLVEYSHQNVVRHLFVDGAAGTQMLRFNGNLSEQDPVLSNLLLESSSFIPYVLLKPEEKDNMLVIGPGGGKEVLGGLVTGVRQITGVEINPDFVEIVKDQRAFNGGIYTDFPNVEILVGEGRQYVKQKPQLFDVLVMALPSTQQLQSIDNYALSENFLLTVEAIRDYMDILTPEGQMIFTVHNPWELKRLIATAMTAFGERGVEPNELLNHMIIFETDYAPTVVIKKQPYSTQDLQGVMQTLSRLRENAPQVTYVPDQWRSLPNTTVNDFLQDIRTGRSGLQTVVENQQYDVTPVYDDSPYFYKIEPGIPEMFNKLFFAILAAGLLIIALPFMSISKKLVKSQKRYIQKVLLLFTAIGIGFMVIEITLFQKLVLYLGSPTISLSILLSSLLIGMGVGSLTGKKIYRDRIETRILVVSGLVVIAGVFVILLYPYLLEKLLIFDVIVRATTAFILLLPFGYLLGILFPSFIQLLEKAEMEEYVPWMYGVNGAMSVLGSVLAVMLSMIFGYTPAFLIGLGFYLLVLLLMFLKRDEG